MKTVIDVPEKLVCEGFERPFTEEEKNILIKAIGNGTPLDEQEPKTGHWCRKTKVDAYDIAGVKTWGIKCQCDRCDFATIVVEDFGYYKYCPNCGAKMEGGNND